MKLFPLVVAAFVALAAADGDDDDEWKKDIDQLTLNGCAICLSTVVTYSYGYQDWSVFCKDINALSSLVGCYRSIGRDNDDMFDFLFELCEDQSMPISENNVTAAFEYLSKNGKTVEEVASMTYNPSQIATFPVIVSEAFASPFVSGQERYDKVYTDSTYYGIGAVCYWIFVCLVSAVANWSMVLFPSLRQSLNGPLGKAWRKYITLPALVRKKRSRLQNVGILYFLIPSRLETIVIAVFFALLVGFCAAGVADYKNDAALFLDENTLVTFIADRCAHICLYLVPVLLLFGGRNNFLIWVTKWKFSTFNTYHRWIGRFVVILALVHGACYSEAFSLAHDYASAMATVFITWGAVALTAGSLMVFLGLLFFRRVWYETFLVIHIVLAVIFVVGAWCHASDLGYANILYASVAVWGLDRAVRIARILVFGFPTAKVTLLEDKLEVKIPRPSYWKPVPGGCAWIHFGDKFWFWQSHPFCYIWDEESVTFYCKVHSGVTKTIQKRLVAATEKSLSIRVAVEGPYGHANPIKHHSDVTFIAGGNGFPGIFSELKDLLNALDSKQKVKLHWVVKTANLFLQMGEHLKTLPEGNEEINVYITSSLSSAELMLTSDIEKDEKGAFGRFRELQEEFPRINFHSGRPDFETVLRLDVEEASNSIAVVCCGPAIMVDELRTMVVESIDKTEKRVDFYDTLQIWA